MICHGKKSIISEISITSAVVWNSNPNPPVQAREALQTARAIQINS